MKKLFAMVLTLAITVCSFAGCTSGNAEVKDGTYSAEYSAADEHGWTDRLDVTVEGGKITAATFDSYDAEGNKKSESEEYNNVMKDAGGTTWPSEFLPAYSTDLVEKQDAAKVDTIAGATVSADSLKVLFKALQTNMSKGDTAEVKVDR